MIVTSKNAPKQLVIADFEGILLLGQGPVLHCGVFRCSEKRNFEKQINHLLCGWLRMLQLTV